jgi:hypothetical protein
MPTLSLALMLTLCASFACASSSSEARHTSEARRHRDLQVASGLLGSQARIWHQQL